MFFANSTKALVPFVSYSHLRRDGDRNGVGVGVIVRVSETVISKLPSPKHPRPIVVTCIHDLKIALHATWLD